MSGNRLVIKYKDGKIVKGWTTDFGQNKEMFHLHPIKRVWKGRYRNNNLRA